jgi:hypothetical protein
MICVTNIIILSLQCSLVAVYFTILSSPNPLHEMRGSLENDELDKILINLHTRSGIFLDILRKATKKCQDNCSPDRDSNHVPLGYKRYKIT